MARFIDLAIQITSVLSSIRLSLDPISARRRLSEDDLDAVAALVGDFEQLRFKFTASSRNYAAGASGSAELIEREKAILGLIQGLDRILSIGKNTELADQFRFRIQQTTRERIPLLLILNERFSDEQSVSEAAISLRNLLSRLIGVKDFEDFLLQVDRPPELNFTDDNPKAAIQNLKQIVPAQKIAPVQFKIDNNKISIEDVQSRSREEDKQNIQIAKTEILNNGGKIVEQLKNSNCDRRLLENIEQLHSQIFGDSNAVQIGLTNISFSVMSETFKTELPDAVSAMLQSHALSIGMYVAQFPDWNKFSENANIANIDTNDARIVDESARFISDYLERHSEIAEPKVIRVLKQLRRVLQNPGQASKRAIFAVMRTVENLLSKAFHYTIDFFEKTAEETKKTASKAAAILIVTLALNSATKLTPIAEKVGELSWIKNAIEIVQKQLKSIK